MNDARLSTDLIAYERARDKEAFRARARALPLSDQPLGRPRGILSVEAAAERQALQDETTTAEDVQTTSAQVVPDSCAGVEDPQALLRHARLGVLVAVVLAVVLVWLRRRRRL